MKIFIVAALLVAAVAGQSFNKDLITPRKGMLVNNRFSNLPYNFGGDYSNMVNYDYDVPSTNYINDDSSNFQVLQYDEIMVHPLFREYISLPLFRQYWSYPMFQRYVCSHYFQQYWTVPAFQQYFVQPTLFYKYIYPIVTLFKYDNTFNTGNFWNKNVYPMEQQYTTGNYYNNKLGVPTVCYTNSVYCRALVEKLYNHLMYTTKMTNVMTPEIMDVNNVESDVYKYNPFVARMMYPTYYNNKEMYPSVYNKEAYPSIYNKEMYPFAYNKEMYPSIYNKEMYPSIYNKEMYPFAYNKEMYPTVFNKDFPSYQVPKTFDNQDLLRPLLNTATVKTITGDKTFDQKFVAPEQVIKA
jgi:hypothetical protein